MVIKANRAHNLSGIRTWLILTIAGVVALGFLLAAFLVERQAREAHRVMQQGQVRESLALLESRLSGNLRSNIYLLRGLVTLIANQPEFDQARFERYARPLFDTRSQLRNIAAAPGMVIRYMYPLAGNEKAVGLDYRKHPGQFAAADLAYRTREIVLAGPVTLAQGGLGLIARVPIFLDHVEPPRFWGLISAVIDVDRLYRDSGLLDDALAIEVALRGLDAEGAHGDVFFGDKALFAGEAVQQTIPLPHGSWQIAARPKGGWSETPPNLGRLRLGFIFAVLLVLGPLLLLAWYDRRHQRAEARLATSEARLSLAVEAARLVTWDWNLKSGKLAGNGMLQQMLGLPPDALQSGLDAVKALMHPEDISRVEAAIESHLHGLVPQLECDFRLRAVDGTWYWFRAMGRIVERNAEGQPVRVSGVMQDITPLKLTLVDLEAARLAAESGSRAKSEFLATMSHEIRTPMNGVLGMADLLLTTSLDEEQKSFVATLQSSGRGLLAVINDILDFSKIEAGRLTLESIEFRMVDLLGEVCDLLRPRAIEKGLLLELDCPEDLPACLQGDAHRIRQILVNLIGNAVKFTRQGRIDVEVGWRPATTAGHALVRLSVRDTGIGIPDDVQAGLFVAFAQADASTTRRFGGTGLGLAICRRLVDAMGGTMGVVSAPGEGACFWFELVLPYCQAVPQHDVSVVAGGAGRFSGRVLVVEDNPVNMQVATQMLARLGIDVVGAENGLRGVEHFAAGHVDLVLMDMQMPEMDGLEATQAIRSMEAKAGSRRVPIVALTANVQAEDRQRCHEAGMNDYVAKPFRQVDIVGVLQRWLPGATRVPTPETVKVGAGGTAAEGTVADLPVLDARALEEIAAATGMSIGELVTMLMADINQLTTGLSAAMAVGQISEMRRMAHSIKSSAAQLGALRLSALAREMEMATRDERIDDFKAREPQLREALEALQNAVAQLPKA
jgi:PAS domain S-box-containing protein